MLDAGSELDNRLGQGTVWLQFWPGSAGHSQLQPSAQPRTAETARVDFTLKINSLLDFAARFEGQGPECPPVAVS